mgnify:CR=1 FL=1
MTDATLAPDAQPTRLTIPAKFGFATGDFAFNLFWNGIGLFMMFFYTDVLGIDPRIAGTIYFIASVWDAVTDPAMGVLADRTRTRWGRYRPYLLFGAVPLALSYPLAFSNPGLTGAALVAWALFTHCTLRTTYTIVSIPYSSLSARLTNDADERAGLAGWRMIGAASGGLTVAVSTPILAQHLGQGSEANGYFWAACLMGALSVGIFWYCFAMMRERADSVAEKAATIPSLGAELSNFFGLFKTNGPLVRMFIAIIVVSLALTMFGKNILYFFKYEMNAPQLAPVALMMPALIMIFCVPLWVMVAQKTSKRTAWLIGGSIAGLGYLAFWFNPSPTPAFVFPIIAVIALGGASFGVLFWSMLPDTVEYGEWKTGVRHEAKVFGFASFAQKAALGLNALILGFLLQGAGYVANQPQTPQTLEAIRAMMSLIPLAGVLISFVVLWRYPIDAQFHRKLREDIASATASRAA